MQHLLEVPTSMQCGGHQGNHFGSTLAERPRHSLGVRRVEVMQKFRVGEVLEARSIIGHDIFHPINEGDLGAVTMVALVEAGDLAEVGGWSAGSIAAFEVTS